LDTDEGEGTDRPGQEVSKDHREVIKNLIDNQGWRYKKPSGGGYPRLCPADTAQASIKVPKTGHSRGNAFSNWIADIRRAGGHWPPGRPLNRDKAGQEMKDAGIKKRSGKGT
jgi:hypothetical protein